MFKCLTSTIVNLNCDFPSSGSSRIDNRLFRNVYSADPRYTSDYVLSQLTLEFFWLSVQLKLEIILTICMLSNETSSYW